MKVLLHTEIPDKTIIDTLRWAMPLSFPILYCTCRYNTISSIMNWNILKFVEEFQ